MNIRSSCLYFILTYVDFGFFRFELFHWVAKFYENYQQQIYIHLYQAEEYIERDYLLMIDPNVWAEQT